MDIMKCHCVFGADYSQWEWLHISCGSAISALMSSSFGNIVEQWMWTDIEYSFIYEQASKLHTFAKFWRLENTQVDLEQFNRLTSDFLSTTGCGQMMP